MSRLLLTGTFSIVLFLSAVCSAGEITLKGDWPQFRGPARDGVSSDTDLLKKWPDNGPPLLWKTQGAGRGYSSLSIVDNRIFTMGDGPSNADDEGEYVTCFDRATGKEFWKSKVAAPWNGGRSDWQSSRSTPTVDGDLLYVITPFGELVCMESADGTEKWRKHLKQDLGGKKGDGWGYSESVLIDGEKVVCTPGGSKATMVALNKTNGEVIWTAVWPKDRGAGHASIVIGSVGETRVYVTTTAGGALAVRASDGKLLWTYPIDRTTAVIPNPIIRDDLVFFTAGYRRGGALLRQLPTENGGVEYEEIYPLNVELANKHGGVVLVGDYLYGDADSRGTPFCADFATGNQLWKSRGSGSGSAAVTSADGHLYIRYSNGVIALAKASPKAYEEVSSFTIPDSGERPSWSHPVVVGGKLYVREQDRIYCYNVKAQ